MPNLYEVRLDAQLQRTITFMKNLEALANAPRK